MKLSTDQGIDDTFTFIVKQNGSVQDISTWGLIFSVSQELPDATPDIQKLNTAEGGGDSQIDMTDAADGEFTVIIDASDTTALNGTYKFDIKYRISSKLKTLVEVSEFIINKVVFKDP